MHRRAARWTISLLAILFLAGGASSGWAKSGKSTKRKAALVNGIVIAQEDVERGMYVLEQRLLSKGKVISPDKVSEARKRVLEGLIEQELLYQESQVKGIKVEEATIDDRLDTLRKRFSSEEQFNSAMSEMNLTRDSLRLQMKRALSIEKFIEEEFVKKIRISETDLKSFYDGHQEFFKQPEQVRASHILIRIDPNMDASQKDEARKKLASIRQRLEKGEDFAVLAKEFSQCPSAARGGDLGYFGRGKMLKPFEDAAFALEPGLVSDIVETKFGYHLIMVKDKKAEGLMAYEEVEGKIEQYLLGQSVRRKKAVYLKELKKGAKVERYLPEEAK
ncbi:MAG: peptidylprolyl isomerase [Desulfobacteraceae bacterium]|jgi:peptidyl-prolyl cis-trans isomerase C